MAERVKMNAYEHELVVTERTNLPPGTKKWAKKCLNKRLRQHARHTIQKSAR